MTPTSGDQRRFYKTCDYAYSHFKRGFLGSIEDARITNDAGEVVWDLAAYVFLDTETAPDYVNPSLWRQARTSQPHGLFRVTERIYQVRGFDIANIVENYRYIR